LYKRPLRGAPRQNNHLKGLCKKVFYVAPRRMMFWGCVKSRFMALRAKFKFETDVFFMILRSKIMKNTSVSKEYSAAVGGKRFFTQPTLAKQIRYFT
jgi:hypothetical protein